MSAPAFTSNLEAAREYAERFAWNVLPLVRGGKDPIGRLVPNGHLDASSYRAPIDRWWTSEPTANIGIACKPSGIAVVDVDPRNQGADSLARLEAEHGKLPDTVTAKTGGGGLHYFFRRPTAELKDGSFADGVEIKANGYVVAAPSLHDSGRYYEWAPSKSPWEAPLAEIPSWIIEARANRKRAKRESDAGAPSGGKFGQSERHDALIQLAGAMAARGCTVAEIEAVAVEMNRARFDPPFDPVRLEQELAGIRRSYGARYDGPMAKDDPAADTETGLARRFAAMFDHSMRWCGAKKCWFHYDGARWITDDGRCAEARAKSFARGLLIGSAATDLSDSERATQARIALASCKGKGIRELVFLARSEPGIGVSPTDFDADPYLLNTPAGTMDLCTLQLRDHDPGDMLTRITGGPYDPDARSEEWDRVLEHALPAAELRDFFQRLCGSFVVGTSTHDVVATIHGPTGTSKSTVMRAVAAAMGDYARSTDYSTFAVSEKRAGRATPELAPLIGRRLVLAYEGGQGVELDAERIKRLSSGDPGAVRDVFESEIEMRPRFKICLVSNFRPRVSGDPALWRRLREVPFTIKVDAPDIGLRDRLENDPTIRAAVLRWLVEGYREFVERGLDQPERVSRATDEFRAESDPFEGFLDEACHLEREAFSTKKALVQRYAAWCADQDLVALLWPDVRKRLVARGCLPKKRHEGHGWVGIELRDEPTQGDAFEEGEEVRHA